jgi:hypothetical protein
MIQKFDVWIFSTRCRTWRGRRAVRAYIKQDAGNLWYPDPTGAVPLEEIKLTYQKPPCIVYIDDRAYRFDGKHWPSVQELYQHKPWHKGGE